MRRLFLLLLILLSLGVVNAFSLVYDNYNLVDATPKGKIVDDRAYEDKVVRIEFDDFTGDYPKFTLRNISNTPLTILWDLCAFVDTTGRSQRVKISDTPFSDRGKPVPPTLVIPRAFISERIVPLDSIVYDGGWIVNNSIPKEAEQTLTVVLTVEQQGRQTTYIFTFESVMISRSVLVQGGTFTMGNTWGGGDGDEKPTHKVTLTYDFYMGKYEVTFNEYDAFCEATGRSKPKDEGWGREQRPVINVSWWDAIAYCNWLSEKEKLPKAYDDKGNLLDKDGRVTTDPSKVVGYRLPTEAEWEYAARGATHHSPYKYSGSDNVNDVAWNTDNSDRKTQEVGKKAPNELGIYDMSGNVGEWCSDWYGNYSSSAQTNPYNNSGSDRANRGGSWYSSAAGVRVAYRTDGSPAYTYFDLGFRIARTVPYEGENRPPLAPYNPSPSDELVDVATVATSVTLVWDSYDPDGDTLTYDVYFGTDSNPKMVSTNQSGKSIGKSNLSHNTTYYWKVVAKDNHGGVTEGPLWKFTTKDVPKPPMVFIEKGSFNMGDIWGDGESNEKPTHKVTLTYDFYMGKYEVTFNEYDAFCEATSKSKPNDQGWGRGSRPVILVSWWDAIAYCNWLSQKEALPVAYRLRGEPSEGQMLDANGNVTTDITKVIGYRLPTEAEWEYAARGGKHHSPYKYSGSDNVNDVAWYWGNAGRKTQEVGKKSPNELGLYDMSGNVWEWCSDWYGNYSSSAQTNLYNSTAGSYRVLRGGSWNNGATRVRVSRRSNDGPTYAYNYLGFRIARTVPYEGENRPPLAPYNPSPSDEAIVGATTVTLVWDSYDPDDDTMTYDVYFDTNVNPSTKVSSNQTENRLIRSSLSYDTTYYWKVVLKDRKGATTEGPVWRFIIQELPLPQMVLVEKGSFTIGDEFGDLWYGCRPTHKVTLTYDFYIGKYEVTFDEYDAFCEATGRSKPKDEGWGREQRPVINVTWWDAIAYCNWLSGKEKLPKAYDDKGNLLDKDGRVTTDPSKVVGYRLPTEAEWEYAARGATHHSPYKYSGSDNVNDVTWYSSNSGSKTQEVGKKAPNELGIYDMSGNVWEWCSDWWYWYTETPKPNPYNSTAGSDRVFRGGCWDDSATYTRVAYRNISTPTYTYFDLGFRIARTVPYEGENRLPLAPYTPSPSDEAIVGATSVTLRWDSDDPDDDTMTYDVYFDTNFKPTTKISSNQAENVLDIKDLLYNTTYYWKVVAKDISGLETESPAWSFETSGPASNTLYVGSEKEFTTIQKAVDAAKTGDTVLIMPGVYEENVSVSKSIIIAGASRDSVILLTPEGNTAGIYVRSVDGITIRDLTIKTPATAVQFSRSSGEITGVTIKGGRFGVSYSGAAGNVLKIDDCLFSAFESETTEGKLAERLTGLYVYGSGHLIVENSIFFLNGTGLYISNDTGFSISDSVFEKNTVALSITGTARGTVEKNRITGNIDNGVLLRSTSTIEFSDNLFYSNARHGFDLFLRSCTDCGCGGTIFNGTVLGSGNIFDDEKAICPLDFSWPENFYRILNLSQSTPNTMALYANRKLFVIVYEEDSGPSVTSIPYQYQGKASPIIDGNLIYLIDEAGRLITLRSSASGIDSVSSLNTNTSPERLLMAGGYLWILDTKTAASVVRVTLDGSGVPIRSEGVYRDWTTPVDIFVSGDLSRIYLADALSGIKVLQREGSAYVDISSRFAISMSGYARAVVASGDYVFAGEAGIDGGLKLFNPGAATKSSIGRYYIVLKLLISDRILYAITDRGVSIISVTNPSTPVILKDLELSQADQISVSGRIMGVRAANKILVFDISCPYNPILLNEYE